MSVWVLPVVIGGTVLAATLTVGALVGIVRALASRLSRRRRTSESKHGSRHDSAASATRGQGGSGSTGRHRLINSR